MPDATREVTNRLFLVGRGRHAHHWWIPLFPLLVALVLVASIAYFLNLSLPATKRPDAKRADYYGERPVAEVVLPRAFAIGLVAGALTFAVALQCGGYMGRLFSANILALFTVATMVAVALLFRDTPPNTTYLRADAADIFLAAVLPIGVPVVVGAILGGQVAAVS
jgi:hypothetical protein